LLPEIETRFQLKPDELKACADSSETYDILKKSSAEGNAAKVEGTPTIYLNGKKLNYGNFLPVLSGAVNSID
jgi:protein-disulfide isomerase